MWKGGKELKCEPKEVFTNTSLAAAPSLLHPLLPPLAAPIAQLVLCEGGSGMVGQRDSRIVGQQSWSRSRAAQSDGRLEG